MTSAGPLPLARFTVATGPWNAMVVELEKVVDIAIDAFDIYVAIDVDLRYHWNYAFQPLRSEHQHKQVIPPNIPKSSNQLCTERSPYPHNISS
jgi:hypothetical protein